MQIIIHRGTHEIGGSCVEIISNESRIIIDIGIPLVDSKGNKFDAVRYKNLSGQELVEQRILPDLKGVYSWDRDNKKIDGLLLSHSHQDHYGYLKYVDKIIPFYLGEAAHKLIDLTVLFTRMEGKIHNPHYIKSGQSFRCGEFKITPFLMDHSAFDAYAFLIEAEGKSLLYSGDFRSHGRKEKAFKWFLHNAPRNIDALLLEGTVFGRDEEDFLTEKDIEDMMIDIVKNTKGMVLIQQSSQNIDRLVSFYRAARQTERLFVVDIYTAHVLNTLREHARLPYPSSKFTNLRVFYPRRLSNRIVNKLGKSFLNKFSRYKITKEEIADKSSNIMMLVRPSLLSDLMMINSFEGASYIYSLWEGYQEEDSMQEMLNYIQLQNINSYQLHTSGHASINTLKKVVRTLKPAKVIPIHTFHPDKYNELGAYVLNVSDCEVINI